MEELKNAISLACFECCESSCKRNLIMKMKDFLTNEYDRENTEHIAVVLAALNTLEII